MLEKAEVENRDENGFLLLARERPGSRRAVGRRRPRLCLERMILSKRLIEVWIEVDDDDFGAGGVHSRSNMNSLKARKFSGRYEDSTSTGSLTHLVSAEEPQYSQHFRAAYFAESYSSRSDKTSRSSFVQV